MRKSRLLPVVVACLVLLAGCSAALGGGGDASPASTTTTAPREPYPDPPADLRNATVEETVIEYEEARLHNELRNRSGVDYFDVGYMYPTTATVLNRSDGGVYLRVEGHYSYSYSTDGSVNDGVPVESLYFANETIVWRVTELD